MLEGAMLEFCEWFKPRTDFPMDLNLALIAMLSQDSWMGGQASQRSEFHIMFWKCGMYAFGHYAENPIFFCVVHLENSMFFFQMEVPGKQWPVQPLGTQNPLPQYCLRWMLQQRKLNFFYLAAIFVCGKLESRVFFTIRSLQASLIVA
jgi:hypothetical protein